MFRRWLHQRRGLRRRRRRPGKIHQRARQAIHLIDDDAIDLARLDVLHQPLHGRAIEVAPGEPAIVISIRQTDPPLALLAGDVGLGAFPLGVERIERLLQPLLGGLAGVDRTADHL